MPKPSKRQRKQAEPRPYNASEAQDEAIEALAISIRAMKKQIVMIEAGCASENGHDPSDRIAFQAKAIATTVDAIRKIDKERERKLASITASDMISWFRALDAAERSRFIRELNQIDTKRSGLA